MWNYEIAEPVYFSYWLSRWIDIQSFGYLGKIRRLLFCTPILKSNLWDEEIEVFEALRIFQLGLIYQVGGSMLGSGVFMKMMSFQSKLSMINWWGTTEDNEGESFSWVKVQEEILVFFQQTFADAVEYLFTCSIVMILVY